MRNSIRHLTVSMAIILAGVCLSLLVAAAWPSAAQSRALYDCDPYAWQPNVNASANTGNGQGYVSCIYEDVYYSYTIRLVNRAGNILTSHSDSDIGSRVVWTATVSCAGAIVHSFLYINVYGTGKSDTSGEVLGCLY